MTHHTAIYLLSLELAREASAAERLRCVLGMLSSLEVKVLRPTWWRWRPSDDARATAARRGLKEAWIKHASRWTKTGYKAQVLDERATYRKVRIHQRCEA